MEAKLWEALTGSAQGAFLHHFIVPTSSTLCPVQSSIEDAHSAVQTYLKENPGLHFSGVVSNAGIGYVALALAPHTSPRPVYPAFRVSY